MKYFVIIFLLICAILGGYYLYEKGVFDQWIAKDNEIVPNGTDIFLVALDGSPLDASLDTEEFGCSDKLIPVDTARNLSPKEAIETLIDHVSENDQMYNVFADSALQVDDVVIDGNKAVVELSGEIRTSGVCDPPRVSAQITETLKQFDEIDDVAIFINGKNVVDLFSEKDGDVKLISPKRDEIYFGAFPDFGGTEDEVTAQKIDDYGKLVNRRIQWAYFSNNWGKDGIAFPKESVEIIESMNATPFIRLMPREKFDTPNDDTYALRKIIDGEFDEQLHQYAHDVRAHGKPILIDFAVEMNGNWFPWSGLYNGGETTDGYGDSQKADGPERYVDAYRHIIDLFRADGVRNVTWFFHPDIHSYPDQPWNQLKEYYPGDDYIDWIGVSIYGPLTPQDEPWETFTEILDMRKDQLLAISPHKPIALLEFGVTDNHEQGVKLAWIEDAFHTIFNKEYPVQFKGIAWWHENWEESNGVEATLRVDSSVASRSTFTTITANSTRFAPELLFK